MRTSAPSAFTSNRLLDEPGTRSMSPKEQKIASGRSAIATALSINSIGVTQTGQPGPCTSEISFGSKSSSPLLTMVWVWPPQISMIVHGRVTFWRIAPANCSAAFWSRYSLRNFTEFLFQSAHLLKVLEDALGFVLVDDADGEPDVDQDVLPDFGFGSVRQVDVLTDAAEVDLADAEGDVAAIDDFNQAAWNCEAHELTSAAKAAIFPLPYGTTKVVPFPFVLIPIVLFPTCYPTLCTNRIRLLRCHHHLPEGDATIVRGDSPMRVHRKSARFKNCCGSLRQITVLKNSAAEYDLLQAALQGHFHDPGDQRIVEASSHHGNRKSGTLVGHYCGDERTPVPTR